MARLDYNAGTETENSYDALPAGEYTAHIKSSDLKDTKAGDKMLVLMWEVLDGPCKGRTLFENINLFNKGQTAREIAQRTMNSICIAAGKPNGVQDSSELHGKAMVIKLTVKDNAEYGPQNVFKKHSPYGKQAPTPAPQQEQAAPQQQQKNPWEK